MNSKGQLQAAGTLLVIAIGVIVALTLLTSSFANVGTMTQTINVVNQSVTAPAAGSTATILRGQAATVVSVINGTSGTVVPATNYTITNYVNSNGQLVTQFTSLNGAGGWQGKSINVTYSYEPFGYDTNSGNRTIVLLIPLFAALALAIFTLVPTLREKLFDMF